MTIEVFIFDEKIGEEIIEDGQTQLEICEFLSIKYGSMGWTNYENKYTNQ